MVSAADFNLFVVAMFWSAIAIFGLAMALMVLLLVVRIRAISRRRHISNIVAAWRRIFTAPVLHAVKQVRRGDAFTVLNLWNDFRRVGSTGGGISAEILEEIARVQNFDKLALAMLRRGDDGDRLVALTFAGYFRLSDALDRIKAFREDSLGEVALAAYRASVLIDSTELKSFVFAIARRSDWRLRSIEGILKELGPERISRPMAIAAEDSSDELVLNLIRFFTLCDPVVARSALLDQLAFRTDPEVIAAALRALAPFVQVGDRDVVQRFLVHPSSFVRIAALGAIAPVCLAADRDVLIALLSDVNSWVRYRAAQTLLDCLSHEDQDGALHREVADKYAQDALAQVLAERSVIALQSFVSDELPSASAPVRQGPERRPAGAMRAEA